MASGEQLLFLELNEVNFESLEFYTRRGLLPNFKAFFDAHGYGATTSEADYDHWEPWIQWVTAHTGLDYAEHGIFRLGDIVETEIPQIWEQLEAEGYRVGAISPMNAKHRLSNAAFFVPDPWTQTDVVAGPVQQRLYQAIARLVNENATGRTSVRDLFDFAIGGVATARPVNYPRYLSLVAAARGRAWNRALFLDQLLADLFVNSVAATRPHFATLFLNAAAHIQHHYMFSSAAYEGEHRNPDWYVAPGNDPILDVYRLYDQILGDIQKRFPDARIMLATGLHQDPHGESTFYWRLKDHASFLTAIGAPFTRVEPRMSRDFLVVCDDAEQALRTQKILESARASDGATLFEIDNRGADLFVTLIYRDDVAETLTFSVGNTLIGTLKDKVAFVAVKNGEHNGIGYFADNGADKLTPATPFPLKTLPSRIKAAVTATPVTH